MKKLTTLLVSALMLSGASSLQARDGRVAGSQVNLNKFDINSTMSKRSATRAQGLQSFKEAASAHALKAAKASTSDSPIEEAVGTVKNYSVTATSWIYFWGYEFDMTYTGMVGEMVFDEANKEVYMKNPISYLPYNTYIKGSYTDNQLSFQFPQPLISESGVVYYANRMVVDEANTDASAYTAAYNVDNSKPVTFSIAADGTITSDDEGNGVIIGIADESGEWAGYGDYDIIYAPFDKEILTYDDVEENFESKFEDWCILSDDGTQSVKVLEYNGKIYIGGVNADNPDALVVGDIDGTTVTFQSEQYVGIDEDYNYYKLFCGLSFEQVYDDWYDEYYTTPVAVENVKFTYDASAGKLSCQGGGIGVVGGEIYDVDGITTYTSYQDPSIERLPENMSYVPKAPYALDYESEDGEAYFEFTIDSLNEDGWPLDSSNLYYRIYFDGNLYTFSSSVYVGMSEDMTDIQVDAEYYDADGYADIYAGDSYYSRYVYFYNDIDNPGVQAVYKDGDKEYCSEIVYADGAGVKDTFVNKTSVSESYIDLSGRQVSQPSNGFFLKTVKYSDGSQKTVKVLVK